MKKNIYQAPEVEIYDVDLNGRVCDFIEISNEPGEADVKMEIGTEEFDIWSEE